MIDDRVVRPAAVPKRLRLVRKGLHGAFDSVPIPVAHGHHHVTVLFLVHDPALRLLVTDGELLGVRGFPQEPDIHRVEVRSLS